VYRFLNEIVDVERTVRFIPNYCRYFLTLFRYRRLGGRPEAGPFRLFPKIHDCTATTAVDPHYFYQGVWAFRQIMKAKPAAHYDVGSQIDFIRYLSALMPVVFIDIRPVELPLPNLRCVKGSILESGFADGSVDSLSCLHVIEHIGLGRYGDPLDPWGSEKAAGELARILAPGGRLYLTTPVGEPCIQFNAHFVRSPAQVKAMFPALDLIEFSMVTDEGQLVENADPAVAAGARYACGLFVFRKPGT
jgi:SAM-dependent methyltransferase